MAEWHIGNCIFECDVNPEDLRIGMFEKKLGKQIKYPRTFFIKLEHVPTGITVTKCDRSQLIALDRCLKELDSLVSQYENSQE